MDSNSVNGLERLNSYLFLDHKGMEKVSFLIKDPGNRSLVLHFILLLNQVMADRHINSVSFQDLVTVPAKR